MISQFKRTPLLFKSILAVVMAVYSVTSMATAASKPIPPDTLINNLFNEVNTRLKQDKDKIAADKGYLVTIGEDVLVPYISFQTMAKQILGKNWRKITPDQRERYTQAFKQRVSSSIVAQYDPGKEYDLKVTGFRTNDANDRAIVNSEVTERDTGKKYQISYKLYLDRKTDHWMVYDVAVEGVSVLQSFKTASAEDFRRNGIEYMINELKRAPDKKDSTSTASGQQAQSAAN